MSRGCAEPPHVGPLLGAYVLGALQPSDVKVVEAHVSACALCGAELERLAAVPQLLRSSGALRGRPRAAAPGRGSSSPRC